MSLGLRVSGGALDGQRAAFDQDSILVGRDPHADVRLDAHRDRDVSARHAEIRRRDGRWLVRDLNSTNGTFLNGVRLAGEAELHDGDRVGCGASGPVLHVELHELPELAGAARAERPSGATARGRRRSRRVLLAAASALGVVALVGYGVAQRRSAAQLAAYDALLRRVDSIRVSAERGAASLTGRVAGLDSALGAERARTDALLATLRAAQRAGRPPTAEVTRRLDEAAHRQSQLTSLAALDYGEVAARNARAVAILAVEMADGSASSGTAFGVTAAGLLVTNRHLVSDDAGGPARRLVVKFSDTDRWLPARLVRRHDRADLALVQVDGGGSFPTVVGLAAKAGGLAAGSPVALIGYPLGADTPMDRGEGDFVARASLTAGVVSKTVDGVVQIDAFAAHGSSGSPVLDRRGAVVGVVYGGPREGNGRIVYAVSVDRVHALLAGERVATLP